MSPGSAPSPELFEQFAAAVGLEVEDFQREIVAEVFSGRRELLVLLPRGNGKTTLMAALALWHLLTTRRAEVICGAASRDQASLLFDKARAMALAHPELERRVDITRRELRVPDGFIRVISADAGKQYGLGPTLALIDELAWHPNDELYIAIRTAMSKRHGTLVTISTAGVGADGPLGRLRTRARGLPSVERSKSLTRAQGPSLAMLEWAVPDEADIDDMAAVKEANPLSAVSIEDLAEAREAIHELAFRRLHANQWTTTEAYWLPPGAWQACATAYEIEDGEPVFIGVDVGGSRAASAVVWVTEDLRVGCEVFQGTEAVLDVQRAVRDLASRFDVREVRFDPWRFQQAALELQTKQDGSSSSHKATQKRTASRAAVRRRRRAAGQAADRPRPQRPRRGRDRQGHPAGMEARQVRARRADRRGRGARDGAGGRRVETRASAATRMGLSKPCLRCGRLTAGSYCDSHRWPSSPGRLSGRRAQRLRKELLRAFAYRCAECGATGVPLEVHHRDHDHRNNTLTNLQPLCRRCHGKAGARS